MREREGGVSERECVYVRHCHPVLTENSSGGGSSASITSGWDTDALSRLRQQENKGIHTDEDATTKGEDGIKKKKAFYCFWFSCLFPLLFGASHKQSTSENTYI